MQTEPKPLPISDEAIFRLLEILITGPIGLYLVEIAQGTRRVVAKENPHRAGWIVTTELVG